MKYETPITYHSKDMANVRHLKKKNFTRLAIACVDLKKLVLKDILQSQIKQSFCR
jgi:hypothetical protein